MHCTLYALCIQFTCFFWRVFSFLHNVMDTDIESFKLKRTLKQKRMSFVGTQTPKRFNKSILFKKKPFILFASLRSPSYSSIHKHLSGKDFIIYYNKIGNIFCVFYQTRFFSLKQTQLFHQVQMGSFIIYCLISNYVFKKS